MMRNKVDELDERPSFVNMRPNLWLVRPMTYIDETSWIDVELDEPISNLKKLPGRMRKIDVKVLEVAGSIKMRIVRPRTVFAPNAVDKRPFVLRKAQTQVVLIGSVKTVREYLHFLLVTGEM